MVSNYNLLSCFPKSVLYFILSSFYIQLESVTEKQNNLQQNKIKAK